MSGDNQRQRKPAPIDPALVIGLGDFGIAVIKQLSARLVVTENALQKEGIKLLVRMGSDGKPKSGLVRLMTLDWKRWGEDPTNPFGTMTFLSDVSYPTLEDVPKTIKEPTPPRPREQDCHDIDKDTGQDTLKRSIDYLKAVAHDLCQHDMPLLAGEYQPSDRNHPLNLRIYLVCAAREVYSTVFTPSLIEALGEAYVRQQQSKGITLLCYVGGTSREEHKGDEQDYVNFQDAEIRRITSLSSSEGLLSSLVEIYDRWEKRPAIGVSKPTCPPLLQACFLLDAKLENFFLPVQKPAYGPEEAVIAAALALSMLVTTNTETFIREHSPLRWRFHTRPPVTASLPVPPASGVANALAGNGPLGLFGSLGVASYTIDPPTLSNYIYNLVAGYFLQEIEDIERNGNVISDSRQPSDELKAYPGDAQEVMHEIKARTPSRIREITSPNTLNKLWDVRKTNSRADLARRLDEIARPLTNDLGLNALEERIRQYQQWYRQKLLPPYLNYRYRLFLSSQPPLSLLANFAEQAITRLEGFIAEMQRDNYLGFKTEEQDKTNFLQNQNQRYAVFARNTVTAIQRELWDPPRRIPSVRPQGRKNALRHCLESLAMHHENLLREIDQAALYWVIQDVIQTLRTVRERIHILCDPSGGQLQLWSTGMELRQSELNEQDHVLERVLLNPKLKNEIKQLSQRLARDSLLWDKRHHILIALLDNNQGQFTSREHIKARLRDWAEEVYSFRVNERANSWVSQFLAGKISERWDEMRQDLSDAAVPFLHYEPYSQDDVTASIELLGVPAPYKKDALLTLAGYPNIHVIDGLDPLRWTFLRLRTGIHLTPMYIDGGIRFSIKASV